MTNKPTTDQISYLQLYIFYFYAPTQSRVSVEGSKGAQTLSFQLIWSSLLNRLQWICPHKRFWCSAFTDSPVRWCCAAVELYCVNAAGVCYSACRHWKKWGGQNNRSTCRMMSYTSAAAGSAGRRQLKVRQLTCVDQRNFKQRSLTKTWISLDFQLSIWNCCLFKCLLVTWNSLHPVKLSNCPTLCFCVLNKRKEGVWNLFLSVFFF